MKLEIEQRLPQVENEAVGNLVQNAITIERRLEAQRNLRKTFACQICNKSNHETADCKSKLWCPSCKMNGHSLENCFKNKNQYPANKTTCQICKKEGHIATQCYSLNECHCARKGDTQPKIVF